MLQKTKSLRYSINVTIKLQKGGTVVKRKYSIKALAAMCGMTIPQLADSANIKPQRLYDISAGRRKISGAELLKLAEIAKVKPEEVKA